MLPHVPLGLTAPCGDLDGDARTSANLLPPAVLVRASGASLLAPQHELFQSESTLVQLQLLLMGVQDRIGSPCFSLQAPGLPGLGSLGSLVIG